jgi:hypothetical protein
LVFCFGFPAAGNRYYLEVDLTGTAEINETGKLRSVLVYLNDLSTHPVSLTLIFRINLIPRWKCGRILARRISGINHIFQARELFSGYSITAPKLTSNASY